MRQRGFTVIEVLFLTLALTVIGVVFWQQFNAIQSTARDDTRRHAINAMYYNLEDIFYAKNDYYPKAISETNLTAMDKELFTDPDNVKLGEANADYRYEPVNCSQDQCKGYELRALMENEADFVKTNRTH